MAELQRRIYENIPVFLQNLLASLDGCKKTKSRYGDGYYSFLIELENLQGLNGKKLKAWQEQEMRRLLRHAAENSPFYREFYRGTDLENIHTIEDLKKLPVLEREILQQNMGSIYTVTEKQGAVACSSGKTGTPLKFLFTKEDLQKRSAFLDFFKKQHGAVNLEMKRASFTAKRLIPAKQQKKIFWRDNHYMKQRLYSSYFCTEQNASVFAENLDKYQPDFIDGLPSAIYELAKYINKHKIFLSFKPAAVFVNSEKLDPQCRAEIEEAFKCPVREVYFSAEGAPFIAECAKGKLHYNLNSGIIETNAIGEMIVTCFNTYGTPLIRYNTGDRIELPEKETVCECGSAYPVFEKVHTRSAECLQSKNKGKLTSAYYSKIGLDFPDAINKMQFIQNSAEAIDVYIEGSDSYTNKVTKSIYETMKYTFGEEMKFNIRIVERIPDITEKYFPLAINRLQEDDCKGSS